jgi:hypothetical protein
MTAGIIADEVTVTRRQVRYGPPSVEKALGALPVMAAFCRRLDIAGISDRACPVRDIAYATHGQVIEALVANRLTSPTPLVHVQLGTGLGGRRGVLSVARGPQRRSHRSGPRRSRPRAGRDRRLDRSQGDRRVRRRGVPHPLGHDLDQPVWGLRLARRELHRAPLRAPEGPRARSVAGPGRARGQRGRRHPPLAPGL